MIKPYRKPSRRAYAPVVSHNTKTYRASVEQQAKLRTVVAYSADDLRRAGYDIIGEPSLPTCHQILRDLADRTSLLCTKYTNTALRVMRLIRQLTPGLLPKLR